MRTTPTSDPDELDEDYPRSCGRSLLSRRTSRVPTPTP